MKQKNIAIFASGTGSNAEQLMKHFSAHPHIHVGVVVSNKATAGVLDIAKRFNIPTVVLDSIGSYESNSIQQILESYQTDYIVLAGFLLKIPDSLVQAFPDRMVNIHPALLPKFGGKGMYGNRVHAAVKEAGEPQTGITIHLVNEHYDEGRVLFQAACDVNEEDSIDDIRQKVQQLEHQHFAPVVEKLVSGEL